MKKNEKNKLVKSYAVALFDAADKISMTDRVFAETAELYEALQKNTDIIKYLGGPLLKDEDKRTILTKTVKEMDFSQPMCGLMEIMADNGRIGLLPEVLKKFTDVYYLRNDISQVNVETAIELSESQKKRLMAALENYLGNKVVVKYKIKPEILGGLLIECDSKLIDDTIKGKLNRLELLMKGTK